MRLGCVITPSQCGEDVKRVSMSITETIMRVDSKKEQPSNACKYNGRLAWNPLREMIPPTTFILIVKSV